MECLVPHPSPQVFGTLDVMPDGWELQHMESLAVTISGYMSKPVFAVWCILCLEVVWGMKAAPLASLFCIGYVNKAAQDGGEPIWVPTTDFVTFTEGIQVPNTLQWWVGQHWNSGWVCWTLRLGSHLLGKN